MSARTTKTIVVTRSTDGIGLDARFAVNTIAPFLLTQRLLPLLGRGSRIVNLSAAAQVPVDPSALRCPPRISAGEAYARSKLALTMWSHHLADELRRDGTAAIAVNRRGLERCDSIALDGP